MKKHLLSNFSKGWVVGNFSPTLFHTSSMEVGVKNYLQGEREVKHYHAVACEWTIIIIGKASFNGILFESGEIVEVGQYERVEFIAVTDVTTVVIKAPSIPFDKYYD